VTGLADALRAAFPALRPGELRVVNVGFGSTVVESANGFIVRAARTGAAARGHAVEAAVLPVLARLLPLPVPVPVLRCPPGPQLPFGAIGYRRLPGQPCRPDTATEKTACDLGSFLAVLHRADARRLPALPGPDEVWQGWCRLRQDTGRLLRSRLTARERQRLDRWWDGFLADADVRHYQPAVRHGDLWYGNLLVQPGGTLSAVLDWELVALADPAQDLALARHLGPAFTGIMVEAYARANGPYSGKIRHRADRHWQLRELTGLPLAAAAGDSEELAECVAKLKAGPVLG
jgi:aminoglycoside phosphotransferase (APT) family kinase protein